MELPRFKLERYFARHEFSARHLLACSDCEPLSMEELLSMADQETGEIWRSLRLGYTESAGHPVLRREIAATYEGIEPSSVVVAAPEECIFLTMTALLAPGDHVVCTFPGYQSLYEIARSLGCEVSLWKPDEADSWRFDPADLGKLLRENTRLVAVNFPHNPTGSLLSQGEFESVIAQARDIGATLLADEMYRHLEFEEGRTLPAACELYDRALSLSGLSKVYGFPGLRLGWLATADSEALNRVCEMKDYTTICLSAPSEVLGIIALRNRGAIIDQQLARVRRNLARLDEFFGDFADCLRWNRPRGGSIGFPRVECAEDTDGFCAELVERADIMLLPGSVFSYGKRHVRIGFGREDLPEVLDRFAEYLAKRFR
jgi:aspartate/methionine/tyrosine aminotransferase